MFKTEDNLNRVKDIIGELDRQLSPLKIQSEAARNFLSIEKEYTTLDVNVTTKEILSERALWEEMKEKNHLLETKEKELSQLMEEKHAEVNQLSQILEDIDSNRQNMQKLLLELVTKEAQLSGQKTVAAEKEKYEESNRAKLLADKKRAESEKDTLLEKEKEITELYEHTKRQLEIKKEEIASIRQKLMGLTGKGSIEELRSVFIERMQTRTSLSNEEQYTIKSLSRLSYQFDKKQYEKDELTERIEKNNDHIKKINEQKEAVQKEIDQALKEYKQESEENNHFQFLFNQEKLKIADANEQMQRLSFQKDHLKEIIENYSGLYAGVRQVMQNKNQLRGVIGVVSELIQVEPVYELGIETALGSTGQFIAVDDEQAAKDGIQYLKSKKAGRATFLPLTIIQSRSISANVIQKIQSVEGFLGVASQLISYNDKYAPIIENVLGTTLIADQLTNALKIAKQVNYRYRIVTLEGDLVNAGGSLTGGAKNSNHSNSILTSKNKLKSIDETFAKLKEEQKIKQKNAEEHAKKIKEQEAKLEEIGLKGEELRMKQQQLLNELAYKEENKERVQKELLAIEYEYTNISKEQKELNAKKEEILSEKGSISKEIEQLQKEIDEWTHNSSENEQRQIDLSHDLNQKQEELAELREQVGRYAQELASMKNELMRYERNMNKVAEEIQAIDEAVSKETMEELSEELDDIVKQKASIDEELKMLTIRERQEKDKQQAIQTDLNSYQVRKEKLNKEKNELSVKMSRIEVKLDHLLEHLSDRHQMSFETAIEIADDSIQLDENKSKVKELRKLLDDIGPVNMEAIAEYETVFERHQFLSEQQEDLIEAKEQLVLTMDQMDNEVKERFKTTFDQIKDAFADIFPKMFGGGHAQLSLSNPNDLLTSGIEITAQPPGKKLQYLSLLSGGERSLTAIALLFAIIEVRPVPFCILDEAEAALDDANITRFGKFLQSFNGEPQFIVITHRKGTMEKADTLYGVTMQEKGVSKLVSVRLNESKTDTRHSPV